MKSKDSLTKGVTEVKNCLTLATFWEGVDWEIFCVLSCRCETFCPTLKCEYKIMTRT